MKKLTLLIFLSSFAFTALFAQTQFYNNSFEEWETIPLTDVPEPVNWSSIKSSDNDLASQAAPVVWGQSDDAHSGSKSLYLKNVYVSLIDYVAPGTITNGRIHVSPDFDPLKSSSYTDVNDNKWHTSIIHRPDSLVGWFKCNPVEGDFGTVKVVLHQDSAAIPGTEDTWIGLAYYELPGSSVTNWTRFSIPFEYYTFALPEFALATITSGNGYSALADSEAWFDDIQFIYNDGTDIADQLQNELNVSYLNGSLNVNIGSVSYDQYGNKNH